VAFGAVVALRLAMRPAAGDWAFALAGALVGPAVEAALAAAGAFDYTEPDLAGVPIWLPAMWANGGLVIRRLFSLSAVPEADEAAERAHVG
jgi:hypothetical protein